MTIHRFFNKTCRRFRLGAAIATVIASAGLHAATTDLATSPLVTASSATVQPNILYMMDDSGSMDWDYMPDTVSSFGTGSYGYASSHCNGVYYDPSVAYAPPVDSTGATYANSSFSSAWMDGFITSRGSINLGTRFQLSLDQSNSAPGSGGGAAYYYVYSGTQTTEALRKYYDTSSTFYRECDSNVGSSPGNGVFTKVTVSSTSGPGGTDERTNFANWFSYYRTRLNMMKSASGLAFKPLDNHYRVGFATMNNNGGSKFLNVGTFDAAQRASWYSMLYSVSANNSTPLLKALSNAGLLYAHKLPSNTLNGVAANDPVQYSCQQNFTILSTDGFWNDATNQTLTAGPSTTAVGNQDGAESRPYLDGASTTYQQSTSQVQQSQTQVAQFTSQLQSRTQQVQTSTSTLQKQTTQLQYSTSTLQQQTSQLQKRTSSNSGFTWTSWAGASSCTLDTSGSSRTDCRTVVTTAYANVSSCTVNSTPDASGYTTQCQYSAWGSWTGASTCTPVAQSSGPSYTVATAKQCQSAVTSAFANATSCTSTTTPDASGNTTQCQYSAWGGWSNATSCTAVAQSTTSPYTVATARQCQTTDTGWVGAGSCSASSSGGTTVTCQTVTTGPTLAASCTGQTANAGNAYTQTTCSTTNVAAATPVSSCTAVAPSAGNNYTGTFCNTVATGPTTVSSCTASVASSSNNWTTTTCSAGTTSGGTSNTLADVAEYYYKTDLRTSALGNDTGALGTSVSTNNVPTSGADAASWQHMTTFTLGLGARGRMIFQSNYQSATSGDYFSIKNGLTANSSTGVCSWQSNGTVCNWPTPNVLGTPENIDDLWHAAVNGRGTYFSATNPTTLATGISSALSGVSVLTSTSAAAATSNPNVTSGDNFVFSSTFTSSEWSGELVSQQMDLTTGAVSATNNWSARDQLDLKAYASRTIYTYDSSTASHIKSFLWGSLTSSEQAYFNLASISTLSQFCASGTTCLSSSDQALAAGTNLVNFLRGDRSHEGLASDPTAYYRQRAHVLSDIVDAEAAYVKAPMYTYADPGYTSFQSANASRPGRVYVAANDGMLHAFNTTTGDETWSYIPSGMLPSLYKLADKNYAGLHRYFLDGTPVSGDVYYGSAWHTILVGGMNGGGTGYYALDVTDPNQPPTVLWEFTDTNMGYTFGNPIITKLKNGTWVVLVASGYNNADGIGRLYVLDAATGALIRTISTGVGTAATPSGLAKIAAWADNAMYDNTTLRVYGGDLLGNVWRFDINGDVGAAGYDAQLLVTLVDAGGTPQSITARPELGKCGSTPLVFVGTGRYLGMSDLTNTQQQSMYAIQDKLGATTFGNPRGSGSGFVRQVQTNTTCPASAPATVCSAGQVVRTSTNNTVSFPTDNGWYLDFADAGERDNTDPALVGGTLVFNTNVPDSTACTIGGYSYQYNLNYCTGGYVSPSVASVRLSNAIATAAVAVKLPTGTVVALSRTGPGTVTTPVQLLPSVYPTRRVSWRELTNDQ